MERVSVWDGWEVHRGGRYLKGGGGRLEVCGYM